MGVDKLGVANTPHNMPHEYDDRTILVHVNGILIQSRLVGPRLDES